MIMNSTSWYAHPAVPLAIGGVALAVVCAVWLWAATFVVRTVAREDRIELVKQAGTIALYVDPELVATLTGSSTDTTLPAYQKLQRQLTRTVAFSNGDIRFAYIFGVQDDSAIYLVDSEQPSSPQYRPPGQVYLSAGESDFYNITHGMAYTRGPYSDDWGSWYTAVVPVLSASGTPIAAVGLDVAADKLDLRVSIVQNAVNVVFGLIALLVLTLTLVGRNITIATIGKSEVSAMH